MRGSRIVLAAFLLLSSAPRSAHAAACSGRGVPEAIALAQQECCPARNRGAYVSCAAHLTNRLVKRGELQASCKHLVFEAGCPGVTTTTSPAATTTTSVGATTTTSPGATTTTSPGATTTTSLGATTTTSAGATTTTSLGATTTTAVGATTTTSEAATTTTSSNPPGSTTSTSQAVGTTTSTTVSSATSTTTTTLGGEPRVGEICGNCIDDDGNGLTDFEDPACCMQTQAFTMSVTRGLLRPHGGTTRLKLKSLLAQAGLADVNPLKQDVFVQIRPTGGTDVLCAKAPADKFMKMHGAFKFWNGHLVASAKGINDILVKVRRDGSVRFSAVGKRVEFTTPPGGTLQVTVGFRDPATAEAGNRCSTQTRAFRTGRQGRLLAP
jgi:hypothetical protein